MQTLDDLRRNGAQKIKANSQDKGKLYVLVLMTLCASVFAIFLSFLNLLYTRQITRKPFPTLVQKVDGETMEIGFEDPTYRSPEVIQRFVSDTLYYLLTMTSYGVNDTEISSLDPSRRLADPVKINVGASTGEITQSAWLASENLEANFADEFRLKLSEMTPRDVFAGKEEVILKIDYLTKPEEVLDTNDRWTGLWSVDVVANLKVYRRNSGGEVKTIPFNKRVYVRPINTYPVTDVEQFGQLATALNQIALSGLQITEIKDLAVTDVF
ncbi:MAG: hypothetical protein AAFW84_09860 [Cyanobacteria bacterium J06635_15]